MRQIGRLLGNSGTVLHTVLLQHDKVACSYTSCDSYTPQITFHVVTGKVILKCKKSETCFVCRELLLLGLLHRGAALNIPQIQIFS